jgi:hypothetical protein
VPTWSYSGVIPDPQWHYAFVTSTGGHAASDDLVATRRWTAPQDMTISITSDLFRDAERGNGVRGLIVLNQSRVLTEALATPKNKRVPLSIQKLAVKKGDTIDFALSSENGDTDSDSFVWTPKISLIKPNGIELLTDARLDFCGADSWPLNRAKPQPALTQLAQVLLMSNEFMFSE